MSNKFLISTVNFTKIAFARLRFVAVFLIAGLIVGYWDDIKNHVDKWTRPAIAPDSLAAHAAGEIEFFCPMHPEVVRDHEGLCPRCGMPLVKRKRGEEMKLPDDVIARVQLTPQRVALANVQATTVEPMRLVRDISAVGMLDLDETKLARLTARVPGRADELYVNYTGQTVRRGEALYSLYSPEVYTAQREYLLSCKRVNELPMSARADQKADASALYNAALQKLILWGVTGEQLDKLEQDYEQTAAFPTHLAVTSPISGIVTKKDVTQGQYLQAGDAAYSVADLSTLWVLARLYEPDIPAVNVGDRAEVVVDSFPNETFFGTVTFKAFQLDPTTRTLDARIAIDNPGLRLRPGMLASVSLKLPVVAEAPTTAPATVPALTPADLGAIYAEALSPYLKAHERLSKDTADQVPALLEQSLAALDPAKDIPSIKFAYDRLAGSVALTKGQSLADLRKSWKDISAAMIDIGKTLGLPPDSRSIKVFRCPMKDALWLQEGSQTINPYYGSEMLNCGAAIESLPRVSVHGPTTMPAVSAGMVLAVPRSAVIDTGKDKIVYVESSAGVFDMKAVKLGALAGEHYPVIDGLMAGDRVVTVGTFLVDAENRLNPTQPRGANP